MKSVERSLLFPNLRAVESIVVPGDDGKPVLCLRDPQGIAPRPAFVPLPLVPVVARFTGRRSIDQIRESLARDEGIAVSKETIETAAKALDDSLFLEGPRFQSAKAEVERTFRNSKTRPAAHAGSAYPGERDELLRFVAEECVAKHHPAEDASPGGPLRALVCPHIDPWRGARGYGSALEALLQGLAKNAKTFVLLGTSHAPMSSPFSLCKKAFATPLGTLEVDANGVDRLARAATFDPYADLLNHAREHSMEFAAVFLKHALEARGMAEGARIVPILCGLGRSQAGKSDPSRDRSSRKFLDELRAYVSETGAVLIAGADLAHVGPRFGDHEPLDSAGRRELDRNDRASIALAKDLAPSDFFANVVADAESRRVCGPGPVFTLLDALAGALPEARGRLLYYDQNVDPDEGSIVSHTGLAFYGPRVSP
jgi:AmmeMemoRadiSam system protein B